MPRKGKVNTRTLTLTCVEKSDKLLSNRRVDAEGLPMWTLEKPMLNPGNIKHQYP